MIALRPFRAIRILKIIVATGFVTGRRPSTTPTGLATAVRPSLSAPSGPWATRPSSEANTCRAANSIFRVLSATLPISVSATAVAARHFALRLTSSLRSASNPSTRVSSQASTAR